MEASVKRECEQFRGVIAALLGYAMAQVHFYCVFCGFGIDREPARVGNPCQCPKCSRLTPVPAVTGLKPPAHDPTVTPGILAVEVKFACPECGGRLGMDSSHAGEKGTCPLCLEEILCPLVSVLVSPPPGEAAEQSGKPAQPILRLSAEEIDFLSNMEPAAPENPLVHAS